MFAFFNKTLKARSINSYEYDSILKRQESERIIVKPPEKFKPAGTLDYLSHHPVIRVEKPPLCVRIV